MTTHYDAVDYGGNAHGITAPNRVGGVARLLGMTSCAPSTARVLELACGNGANLIPLASRWPGASFLGIDLAETAILSAQKHSMELGLSNIAFRAADIALLRPGDLGAFDYVIVHGLYSWVPEPVRRATLGLIASVLAPGGVAYVSYNALPGCRIRHLVRDLLAIRLRGRPYSASIIEPAWSFIRELDAIPVEGAPGFFAALHEEIHQAASVSAEFLFHDDLSPDNQPFYLHQFASDAAAHGLAYLGDASIDQMREPEGNAELSAWIDRMSAGDGVLRQQYVDFVTGARFKRSLVCRAGDLPGEADLRPVASRALWTGELEPEGSVERLDDSEARFSGSTHPGVSTNHPAIKSALMLMHERPDRTISVDDLAGVIRSNGLDAEARQTLAGQVLMRLANAGLTAPVVEPQPSGFSRDIGEGPLPALTPLALAKLSAGAPMVDAGHHNVLLSRPWMNRAALALDGRRDTEDLLRELERTRADFPSPEDGLPEPGRLRAALASLVGMLGRRDLLVRGS